MSQIALLVVLLLVAYFGGALRAGQKVGMASGTEYVLLGLILGPHLVGLLTHDSIRGFEPLLLMALGWLGSSLGMGYGLHEDKRIGAGLFGYGVLLSVLSCIGIGWCVAVVAERSTGLPPATAHLVGLATGAVAAGTGHHAVNWAMRKGAKESSLRELLSGLGNVDDLPPLLALSGLVILAPPVTTRNWSGTQIAAAGLGLGVVLGGTVAALLGSRLRRAELWPVLLGAVLLVVGIVLRFGLPLLAPVFLFGLSVTVLSPHRTVIRQLVRGTERPLFLPTLLLAGALVELPHDAGEWSLVAAALGARLLVQLIGGFLLPVFFPAARGHGLLLGQALLPASGASLAMGVVVHLMRPGEVGRIALLVAVAATLLGEILGSRALRQLARLEQAEDGVGRASVAPPSGSHA